MAPKKKQSYTTNRDTDRVCTLVGRHGLRAYRALPPNSVRCVARMFGGSATQHPALVNCQLLNR